MQYGTAAVQDHTKIAKKKATQIMSLQLQQLTGQKRPTRLQSYNERPSNTEDLQRYLCYYCKKSLGILKRACYKF